MDDVYTQFRRGGGVQIRGGGSISASGFGPGESISTSGFGPGGSNLGGVQIAGTPALVNA